MDHREAVFAECADEGGTFDLASLAERLLLFERVIVRSVRLEEVPPLVDAMGVDGLTRLINSGALSLDCNAYAFGNYQNGPVQPFTYTITCVKGVERLNETVKRRIQAAVRAIPDARKVQREKLANALERKGAVRMAEDFLASALADTTRDLVGNLSAEHEAIALAAGEIVGMKIRPADLKVRVHQEKETRFHVENNLLQIGLDEARAHKVIEGALLAVATTEQKLEQMRTHASVAIFREEEVRVLQAKISFAWDQVLGDGQAKRLDRVLTIAGFPDFADAVETRTLDFARLLDVRESPECVAFRHWLRTTEEVPDGELSERIRSVQNKAGALVRDRKGKVVRWLVNSAIGALPVTAAFGPTAGAVAGPLLGAAVGALDSFLLEKVLPASGPVAFLNNSVRSILKG